MNNNSGVYLLEKNKTSISNEINLGVGATTIQSEDFTKFALDKTGDKDVLRFTPFDKFKFDVDYDIKFY